MVIAVAIALVALGQLTLVSIVHELRRKVRWMQREILILQGPITDDEQAALAKALSEVKFK